MDLIRFVMLLAIGVANAQISLRHLDTEYLPQCIDGCSNEYVYNVDAAEQLVYDDNGPYIYAVGVNLIHVLDYTTPTALQRIASREFGTLATLETTDVEACGDYVAVGLNNKASPRDGKLIIMRRYNPDDDEKIPVLHDLTVGALPDMIKFTKDCSRILVAIEGELAVDTDGSVFDPEGAVVIVSFDESTATMETADFTAFNDQAEDYISRGVRWVYRGEGAGLTTRFSQDLEPEYIAITEDDSTAYIALQENNAIAVLDIASATITEIYPLTALSWADSALDASDRDGVINRAPWRVMNLGQPDGIKLITIGGQEYLLTADEGDTKEYEEPDFPFEWSESKRGNAFTNSELDVDSELRGQLDDNNQLGRLDLSTVDGANAEGDYETLYSYGQRSFSLYRTSDWSLVYNSRGELEEKISQLYPTIFNTNPNSESSTPEEAFDTRSDNRGPEPEAIETGVIDGTTIVFVGIERPGFVAVYTLDESGATPTFNFQSLNYAGGFGRPWEDLYADRMTRDLDPEDVRFISANDANNPTGMNMLAVSGAYSGTVTFYEVAGAPVSTNVETYAVDDKDGVATPGLSVGAIIGICMGCIAVVLVVGFALGVSIKKSRFSNSKTMSTVELAKPTKA